jgi:hypothetical protein
MSEELSLVPTNGIQLPRLFEERAPFATDEAVPA